MRASVLIVGAGIAGMRAAAELVQQGFEVHLLEKKREIGGKMAILDRIYPTGEHSLCAQRPLTEILDRNPKLTLLTSSDLLSLRGFAGDFTATVLQREVDGADPRKLELRVGAVIIATGLEEERTEALRRFGYGRLPDLITQLEFEQQVSGLGPTGGIVRTHTGNEPRTVTWIIGQSDSAVCLMSAATQAQTLRRKSEDVRVTVLLETQVTQGKGYEALCMEAEKEGVSFVRGSSVEIDETEGTGLLLSYAAEDGERVELPSDVVVVSTPLIPGDGMQDLAVKLGLALNEDGWIARDPSTNHPLCTTREGVFMCGAVQSSKGISESVVQAGAAASHVAALLAFTRSNASPEDTKPPGGSAPARYDASEEQPDPGSPTDEPRILVLIDQGEEGIAGILDLGDLAEFARTLPGVERVEVTSSAAGGAAIRELLAAGAFNRLVVAGPSPITHETVVQRHAESAGLNRYLVEMVNLHQQCARVHAKDRAAANWKAKVLVRMGVVRARKLESLTPIKIDITQCCLVVGGNPSGITCANQLARTGLKVHLVEREADLKRISGNDHPLVEPRGPEKRANSHVEIHTQARVGGVRGAVGNFEVEVLCQNGTKCVTVGAIVVAEPAGAGSNPADAARSQEGTVTPAFRESLGLERDAAGFYLGTEGLLNPQDFTTAGVFNCGLARADLGIEDIVVDGEAAASRAACILSSAVMLRPPVISIVVDDNCDGCAYCVEPCPTRSITLLEYVQGNSLKKTIEVSDATCIGCGICMSTCPKKGAFVRHYRLETFSEMVDAALERHDEKDAEPIIVAFCCNRCAYPGADAAGMAGIQYPAGVRIIRPVCAGMVHPNAITDALTRGADGVLLCGCHVGECRSREGIRRALGRVEAIQLLLEDFGLEQERFRLEHIAASEGAKFARIVTEMTEQLAGFGPSPYSA
jgi:heterodisulfide reductase subunit A-like polyferredoxin/coenzyme F420-reducing hydrogenase delta subunit